MKVSAFGVLKFDGKTGQALPPPVCIQQINDKLTAMGLSAENVISITMDDTYYHVFVKSA